MCFVAGCGVATPGGVRPVETIVQGDLVLTHDGRAEPVLWVGLTRVTWAEQMGNARRRPVRIGNGAYGQLQMDIYGELIDAVYLYDKYGTPIGYDFWMHVRRLVNWVCDN